MNQTDHYPKEENKKVIELMKDKSGGKIKKEFNALRAKKYVIKQLNLKIE